MKLYYSPGSCALSPHIVLNELGLKFDLEKVDLRSKTFSGGDYKKINPKGSVPLLQLDNGEPLTEGVVINQYLADQNGNSLAPKMGTFERYRLMEMLTYLTSEVHKGFTPLFAADLLVPAEVTATFKQNVITNLAKKFDFLNTKLEGQQFLVGNQFTIADAYLYTMLRWTKPTKIELNKWPALMAFFERIETRPAVQKSLKEEGLH
ncbi:MAG: glutathione transferase GstA [Bdellovibrionales bacterium]|nr:glutathione transferase GstA [Bdellovibrionales bacterium]